MNRFIGKFLCRRRGQSLIEVLIAISVGGLILGLATASVGVVLKSGASAKNYAAASSYLEETMNNVTTLTERSWSNIYTISPKGSSNKFFLVASGTLMRVVKGTDYFLTDEVRNGLVGYWRFDEGSNNVAIDYSGNNNNGTIVGPSWQNQSNCRLGNCLSFNGLDQYVTISHNNAFVPSSLTIAAWVKPNNFSSYMQVVSKFSETSNFSYQLNITNAGKLRIDSSSNGSTYGTLISENSLISGIWNYVVTTWDGTKWRLFINGVEDINILGFAGPLFNGNTSLDIGRVSGGGVNGQYFNGNIDEVRLYDRALVSEEIQKIYKSNFYSRYFNIENVNRDGLNNIVTTSGLDDPSTQKITAVVEFGNVNPPSSVKLIKYITRWKTFSGIFSDWSGGPNEEGPISVDSASNKFKNASATIDYLSNPGSIKLKLQ